MQRTPRVERTLSYFSKVDERLVGEYPLDGVGLPFLWELYGVPADDPLHEVCPVRPSEAARLQPFVPDRIDLQNYDYFVECHAVSERPSTAPEAATDETGTASAGR